MRKIIPWTIIALSLIAGVAINIHLARPIASIGELSLIQIEALSEEIYDGGELPTVTITCSASPCSVGRCWIEANPGKPNKTCIISGSMNTSCSYNCSN